MKELLMALPMPQLGIDKQFILDGRLTQLQHEDLRLRDQFSICMRQKPSVSLRQSVYILEKQA